jgi:DNA-binding Lrp family transcriptional regulator
MQRKAVLDELDLKIISLLSMNCRVSHRNISSSVGLTPNAVKSRVNKLISCGIIKDFILRVNPAIFGYEKEYSLTIRNIGKMDKEDGVINKLSLLGEVLVYAKQLGGLSICVLAIKGGSEDKIGLMGDVLKPAIIEKTMLVNYKPVSVKIQISDLKVIKCLFSDPRIQIKDIAKKTSLSVRTMTRWLEKMKENHILEFTILRDMSSIHLVGYIEFALIINVAKSLYQNVVNRIYREMEEYLLFMPNIYNNDVIFAVFFCANINTVDRILTKLQVYDGIQRIEIFITTRLTFFQEWLKREVDKRLNQMY